MSLFSVCAGNFSPLFNVWELHMRRISLMVLTGLALSLVGSVLLLSGSALHAVAQDAEKEKSKAKSPLEGAWRLVSARQRDGEMRKPPEGIDMSKLIVGGRFVWTHVQEGKVTAGAGGRYKATDEAYTEDVVFAIGPNHQHLIGQSVKFSWKIEDGKWHHKGKVRVGDAEAEVEEIWERIP